MNFYVLATPRSATATTVGIKVKLLKTRVRPTICQVVVWRTEYYMRYSKLYQVESSYAEQVTSSRVLLLFRVCYTELNIFAILSMLHRFFFIRITRLKIAKKIRNILRIMLRLKVSYFDKNLRIVCSKIVIYCDLF